MRCMPCRSGAWNSSPKGQGDALVCVSCFVCGARAAGRCKRRPNVVIHGYIAVLRLGQRIQPSIIFVVGMPPACTTTPSTTTLGVAITPKLTISA